MFTLRIHWTGHSPPGRFGAQKLSNGNDSPTACLRVTNIFVIGEGTKAWVTLPKGKGTKLTIAEERDLRRRQRLAEASQS